MTVAHDTTPRSLCRLSQHVYKVLERFTTFPWPIMQTACRRQGIDPTDLTPVKLGQVIQGLALGVARFNDVSAGVAARRALVALQRDPTAAAAPPVQRLLP